MARILVDEYMDAEKPVMGMGQPQHIDSDPRAEPIHVKQEDLERIRSQALNYVENTLRYASDEELEAGFTMLEKALRSVGEEHGLPC